MEMKQIAEFNFCEWLSHKGSERMICFEKRRVSTSVYASID